MRLSDERLNEIALNVLQQKRREIITGEVGHIALKPETAAALIAEVRALRECEQFAENMAEHDCAYGDNCPTFGSRHGRCTGCAARAALAAVRALEDKP